MNDLGTGSQISSSLRIDHELGGYRSCRYCRKGGESNEQTLLALSTYPIPNAMVHTTYAAVFRISMNIFNPLGHGNAHDILGRNHKHILHSFSFVGGKSSVIYFGVFNSLVSDSKNSPDMKQNLTKPSFALQ